MNVSHHVVHANEDAPWACLQFGFMLARRPEIKHGTAVGPDVASDVNHAYRIIKARMSALGFPNAAYLDRRSLRT